MEIVNESNMAQAVSILADAFHDDPVMNWMLGNPESMAPVFELMLPTFVPHGYTYMDPQGRGVASWLGPSQKLKWDFNLSNAARVFRLGGLTSLYRLSLGAITTEKHHPEKPHYFLFAIGASSARRGQGIGTSLITHLLRSCDEEQIPAYLENSKEENLRFYQGHGFEVMEQIRFKKSAPPLWLMWREPKSA